MDVLLLRFDAPLMSFGGVMIDQKGITDRFPGCSMLAGLLGNALGYRHRDAEKLQMLQSSLDYAARWDVKPDLLVDYNTVCLKQPKMRGLGWTTRGAPEHRAGGESARLGIHQRYRHYWTNGVMTVAVAVIAEQPMTEILARALREPARPLFIGRKTCLPSAPIFLDKVDAPDLLSALRLAPISRRPDAVPQTGVEACWPAHLGPRGPSRQVAVYDCRDWLNQVHAGRRLRYEGIIEVTS